MAEPVRFAPTWLGPIPKIPLWKLSAMRHRWTASGACGHALAPIDSAPRLSPKMRNQLSSPARGSPPEERFPKEQSLRSSAPKSSAPKVLGGTTTIEF